MDTEVRGESQSHEPVLLAEIVDFLRPEGGGTFVDCTLGLGGHAAAILKASPAARVIGIDRDRDALAIAERRLAIFDKRFQAVHANFTEIGRVLAERAAENVAGVLADLGVSSLQLDRGERGFSFTIDAPLDMRMDQSQGETAAALVNRLTERELADIIFEYGEERGARRIARAIVRERERAEVANTKQLADLVVRVLHPRGRWRIHPATRTFQALRIAVNQELRAVEAFIPDAITALAQGGRLAIIAFHSLEDRIVKRSFLRESGRCDCPIEVRGIAQASQRFAENGLESSGEQRGDSRASGDVACPLCGARRRVHLLTRKPVRPSAAECARNPRSRSALLRVCEKL
ncbi:MAG TPA: 16S rRNA (cytosine(1402)-N(4))-methyltransferase RsmH [Blastocatellia bacterium]|nr:16S rRNA (cytosine(1402)-N(4))-methyltransferase RsmH [Blastocatellia bacterium]